MEVDLSEFEPIKGFEDYLIHRDGRVWTTKSFKFMRIVKNTGYMCLNLRKGNKTYSKLLHRLLMLQFVPNPLNLCCVNHINEIKTDNRLENLEWITVGDNVRHSGLGSKHHSFKNKQYYNSNAVPRGKFKRACNTHGWDFNSFEEIDSGEVYISRSKKYYYLEHEKHRIIATRRDSFRGHCATFNLKFNDFEEVDSGEVQLCNTKKYFYKAKTK